MCSSLYEYLDGGRVPKESSGAGAESVSTGLEQHDQISDVGLRQSDIVSQQVQGSAQTADNVYSFIDLVAEAITDRDRIVSSDHLSEVAGCSELMMQAAINNQILAPP